MDQNIKKLINYQSKGILSKDIFKKNNNANTTLFCMAGKTDISEHTSTKAGFVYVIEGRGVFNLEGKEIVMTAGVLIFMKENARHSIKADENTSFFLMLNNASQ